MHEADNRVIVESTNEVRFFLPGLISFNQPVVLSKMNLHQRYLRMPPSVMKEMMYPGQSSRLS